MKSHANHLAKSSPLTFGREEQTSGNAGQMLSDGSVPRARRLLRLLPLRHGVHGARGIVVTGRAAGSSDSAPNRHEHMPPSVMAAAQLTRERPMCEQKSKSPRIGPLCKTTLLLCMVGIAGCQVGSLGGDVRSAAREAQCNTNLRTLYDALVKYVSLHGDVPRGKDGKASIDLLDDPKIQKEVGIDSSTLRCPADRNSSGPSYVLNPALSVHDLGRDSATIVACDRLPNHVGAYTHNRVTVVLIGDGATVRMDLPLKEQEEWRRLFLSGDKRACSVSMKEGNRTSSGAMWWVGEEKGYVPNE